MKIVLVYILPLNAKTTYAGYPQRWANAYLDAQGKAERQIPHRVVVSFSGGEPTNDDLNVFAGVSPEFVTGYNGPGWDIGHYQWIVRQPVCANADFVLFCGTRTRIHDPKWLRLFREAFVKFGPNCLLGASASYESACQDAKRFPGPNPHIRTTGFALNPKVFGRYPYQIQSREDCFRFEAGAWSVTRWFKHSAYPSIMVAADGHCYTAEEWRRPANIFRRGNQSNCLIWDAHMDIYAAAPTAEKRRLARIADGLPVRQRLYAMTTPEQIGFAARLQAFYRDTQADAHPHLHPLWKRICDEEHSALHRALLEGQPQDVVAVLSGERGFAFMHGIESSAFRPLDDAFSQSCRDMLLFKLGHPLPNPEQPFTPRLQLSLADFEVELGFGITVPKLFGSQEVSGGNVFERTYWAAYYAVAMRQFLGSPPSHVLEIGGGCGLLAIALRRACSLTRYTCIDLPPVAVIGAWAVACVFKPSDVGFEREAGAWAHYVASQREIDSLPHLDAVVNTDSLPEMTLEEQDKYIRIAARFLSVGGLFYSVNHESQSGGQSSVFAAMQRNKLFRLAHRSMFPMRLGYVEEFWIKNPEP